MKLLKQQKPTCLLYSAAMALDVDPAAISAYLGRDGSELRSCGPVGVHMQEIMDYALSIGSLFYLVLPAPVQKYNDGTTRQVFPQQGKRFASHIEGKQGILIGRYRDGEDHAVAFKSLQIYDPNGAKYGMPSGKFMIEEAWICVCLHRPA